jgi:hypothetical protein
MTNGTDAFHVAGRFFSSLLICSLYLKPPIVLKFQMYYIFMGLVFFGAIYWIQALKNSWSFCLGLLWIFFVVQFILKIDDNKNELFFLLVGFSLHFF